jgi:hypothetical protein
MFSIIHVTQKTEVVAKIAVLDANDVTSEEV